MATSIFGAPRRITFFTCPHLNAYLEYHSRAHRKNRHAKIVQEGEGLEPIAVVPNLPSLFNGWSDLSNISFHVAIWFCLGSICWIVNGQYALMQSSAQHVVDAIAWSGFAGGTCFWIGAYLAVVESLNLNSNLLYGVEVEKVVGRLKEELLQYHTAGAGRAVYRHKDTSGDAIIRPSWRWVGYSNTIGFWASFIQFIGATFFEIAVICGIPGVIGPEQWQLQQTFIWTMQTVGSVAFIVSSWMMMIEEQDNLWMPKLGRMGWESAFWNLIGSWGFLLSAVFGYLANWEGRGVVCCQLGGTAVSTYWGSWAFMIASLALYYEVENKKEQSFHVTMRVLWIWLTSKCGCARRGKQHDAKEEGGGGGGGGDAEEGEALKREKP